MITTGPTGRIIIGHILDCNPKSVEQTLKDYDSKLYIKWNPNKLKGWGVWEVRRLPNEKVMVDYSKLDEKTTIVRLEYKENNMIHHVLDCPFMDYSVVEKVKKMDIWNNPEWVANLEYDEDKRQELIKQKARDEMRYNLRHHRSMARDLQNAVRDGIHPASFLKGMKVR